VNVDTLNVILALQIAAGLLFVAALASLGATLAFGGRDA
jgi:hypothetical protein